MDELVAVTDNGVPAYMCALWDGESHHTERLKGGEERRIVRAEGLELTPLDVKARIVETIEYGKNTTTPEEFE